jgi:tetratricopeptide (TPR) repeat protein
LIRALPDNPVRHNNFADWLFHQDRLAEAEIEARVAIKINPKLAVARCTLGEVLYAAGKRIEAETEFDEALRLDPTLVVTHFSISQACAHAGEWEKAVKAVVRVLELSPGDRWARQYRAAYALAGNDVEAYRRECAEALKLCAEEKVPYNVYILVRACVLAENAVPNPALLVELMTKIVKDTPNADMLFALGMAHYRAGQYDEALARLNQALSTDFSWTDTTCVTGLALAMVHHRLGHLEEARKSFAQTVERLERGAPEKWRAGYFPPHEGDWVACVVLRKEAENLLGLWAPKKNSK